MFDSILLVCDGNICRSPMAAALLRTLRPEKKVSSAGLVALEGHDMDDTARTVAEANGVPCPPHAGRKLSGTLCHEADLILVMEARQRDRIIQRYPEVSGKTFLLTRWSGGQDIPDPFHRGREVFERIFPALRQAVETWAAKL